MLKVIQGMAGAIALILLCVLLIETIALVNKSYETVDTAQSFLKFQTDIIRSPAYQKNIEHASEAGDLAAKTIAQFARRTLPRVDKNLDGLFDLQNELRGSAREATGTVAELGKFIRDSNYSLNQELLPEITSVAKAARVSVEDVDQVVKAGLVSVETLDRILANPDIPEIITNVKGTTAELNRTSKNIADTTAKFPELAELFNKYARTANKWHKWVLLAQILNLLAGLPRP